MDLPDIIYKKSPPLAFISLNRPETRNVFTYPMMESLRKVLKDAKKEPDIKVVILSGEGGAFLAGGNIKEMAVYNGLRFDLRGHLDYVSSRLAL